MARKYKRKYKIARSIKTTKYSNETYAADFALAQDQATPGSRAIAWFDVVPKTDILGTRKVKNFTVRITCDKQSQTVGATSTYSRGIVFFALVYVPEGLTPMAPQLGTSVAARSIYEPNQNVIMTGLFDSEQTYTFKSRLARNLNSGDRLCLVFLDVNEATIQDESTHTPITFLINYAIAF